MEYYLLSGEVKLPGWGTSAAGGCGVKEKGKYLTDKDSKVQGEGNRLKTSGALQDVTGKGKVWARAARKSMGSEYILSLYRKGD